MPFSWKLRACGRFRCFVALGAGNVFSYATTQAVVAEKIQHSILFADTSHAYHESVRYDHMPMMLRDVYSMMLAC